jgi:hypothetical protein
MRKRINLLKIGRRGLGLKGSEQSKSVLCFYCLASRILIARITASNSSWMIPVLVKIG